MADGVDIVVDLVGGQAAADAIHAARDHGRFVTTIASDPPAGERGIEPATVGVQPDRAALEEIASLAAAGTVSPVPVAERFTLAQAHDAFARLAAGGVKGKVVLTG